MAAFGSAASHICTCLFVRNQPDLILAVENSGKIPPSEAWHYIDSINEDFQQFQVGAKRKSLTEKVRAQKALNNFNIFG